MGNRLTDNTVAEVIQTTVYTLDELDSHAKSRARDWYRQVSNGDDWQVAVFGVLPALADRVSAILLRHQASRAA